MRQVLDGRLGLACSCFSPLVADQHFHAIVHRNDSANGLAIDAQRMPVSRETHANSAYRAWFHGQQKGLCAKQATIRLV